MTGWLPLIQSQFFKMVQNVGTLGQDGLQYINLWKNSDVRVNGNSPTVLNDNAYPASTLTDNLSYVITLPGYSGAAAATWVLKWTGTFGASSIGLNIIANITVGATSGVTVIGSGSSNTVVRGTNGRMEFTFNSYIAGINTFGTYFQSGCTFSGLSNLVLCRKTDEAAVDGGAIWMPESLASMTALNPGVIRFMGPTCGGSGSEIPCNGNWAYRLPTTAASYTIFRPYVSGIWCGAIINSGPTYTAPSYTDMPGSYTDGEVFMGTISTSSAAIAVSAVTTSSGKVKLTIPSTTGMTTGDPIGYDGYQTNAGGSYSRGIWSITVLTGTTIELTTGWTTGAASVFITPFATPNYGSISAATINSGARGRRPVVGLYQPSGNDIPGSGQVSFVYRRVTNAFHACAGALFTGVNPELIVNLCNTLNKHLWLNFNFYTTDSTVTSAITYVKNNLNSNLDCVLEHTNETFNFGFRQFFGCWDSALALNIGTDGLDSSLCAQTWSGLRSAEVFDLAAAAWSGRTASQLKPTLTNWGFGQLASEFQANKLNGSLLNATTNSVLSAYTGGKRYDQGSPTFNRPVDRCRLLSFACYPFIGSQTVADYITFAQQYASGATTTALDNFDAAMRTAVTSKYSDSGKPYEVYDTMAGSYDGSSRPAGFASLEIWMYEGGYEIAGPNGTFYLPLVSDYVTAGYSTSSTVTFNVGSSPGVNWASSTPVNGTRVRFSGGVLPASLFSTIDYYVINSVPGVGFDVALCTQPGVPAPIPALAVPIAITGSPSGTTTATGNQYSIDNVVVAWLQDARSAAWVNFYCGGIAQFPHWKRVSFLQLEGFNPWSLYPGSMSTTPFKTYDGLVAWNSNARN